MTCSWANLWIIDIWNIYTIFCVHRDRSTPQNASVQKSWMWDTFPRGHVVNFQIRSRPPRSARTRGRDTRLVPGFRDDCGRRKAIAPGVEFPDRLNVPFDSVNIFPAHRSTLNRGKCEPFSKLLGPRRHDWRMPEGTFHESHAFRIFGVWFIISAQGITLQILHRGIVKLFRTKEINQFQQ